MTYDIDKLLEDTIQMVRDSDETLDQIAKGAGLSYHWVAKFSQGRIPEPGISKIGRLYNYLNRRAA